MLNIYNSISVWNILVKQWACAFTCILTKSIHWFYLLSLNQNWHFNVLIISSASICHYQHDKRNKRLEYNTRIHSSHQYNYAYRSRAYSSIKFFMFIYIINRRGALTPMSVTDILLYLTRTKSFRTNCGRVLARYASNKKWNAVL